MATEQDDAPDTDDRLDEVQEDIDEVRARLGKNPGMAVPDPDVDPVMGRDADTNPPL